MPSVPIIVAEGLTRRYRAVCALDGVDLSLGASGGITAILGPNGAGKTTFVHTALGLVRPTKGRLSVFGGTPGSMANRRRIGAMLQDTELSALLTPREQIDLFSSYYPTPMPAEEVISLCEMTSFVDRAYKKLSGGQKRRVQFALAVLGRPDIIFLDEPTTGLDIEARRVLWSTIRQLAEGGTSIILTTHYLEEADVLADRIIVFQAGKVIADDTAEAIRTRMGGAVIRCTTSLDEGQIIRMPAVTSARRSGRFVDISSVDAATTLRALLAADAGLSDLTVSKPTLEDAFVRLTENAGDAS